MNVEWVLPDGSTGSESLQALARTTTNRVRLRGATTGRYLAGCGDHNTRLTHSSMAGKTNGHSILKLAPGRESPGSQPPLARKTMCVANLPIFRDAGLHESVFHYYQHFILSYVTDCFDDFRSKVTPVIPRDTPAIPKFPVRTHSFYPTG
jgi:hypothetical protein